MAATRLYVIVARRARTAVVFRRGPSKRVRLLRWDLTGDHFEPGQWFKGRVYERRCDLSPDGTKLIYFAANWKPGHASWTAVSKLPYFTALALWPKGDAWGGGGLFETGPESGHVRRDGRGHLLAAPRCGRTNDDSRKRDMPFRISTPSMRTLSDPARFLRRARADTLRSRRCLPMTANRSGVCSSIPTARCCPNGSSSS